MEIVPKACDKTVVPFYAQGIILLQGKGGEEVWLTFSVKISALFPYLFKYSSFRRPVGFESGCILQQMPKKEMFHIILSHTWIRTSV